jgi:hypothetical protein
VTFFASLVLVFVLVIRPQEIWPALEALHLLDVFTALVVVGLVVEIAVGKQTRLYSPQLPFFGGFIAACYLMSAAALGTGRAMEIATRHATIPAVFAVAVIYGARTLPQLRSMLWLLVTLGLFVTAVAVHQGLTPASCIAKEHDEEGALVLNLDAADGRVCGLPQDCRLDDHPETEWACEHLGLFKTSSVGRRVRWLGQLADPNELAVFIGAVIPLLIALLLPTTGPQPFGNRNLALLAVAAALGLFLYAVILSQSRGGQLVVATVFMAYFVARFGKIGLVGACVLALPVLLLGGRDDAAADESSTERLELIYEGVSLVIAHPLRGVGVHQFADQVNSPLHLSAHNSYLLAAAELGFPGFFFWSGVVWTSLKIPIVALKRATLSAEVRSIALTLLVSFCGIVVGIFFLSFTYKQLLFVWFGLSGALYRIAKHEDPELEMKVGWKDYVGIAAADFAMIGLLYAYTRARGAG